MSSKPALSTQSVQDWPELERDYQESRRGEIFFK